MLPDIFDREVVIIFPHLSGDSDRSGGDKLIDFNGKVGSLADCCLGELECKHAQPVR